MPAQAVIRRLRPTAQDFNPTLLVATAPNRLPRIQTAEMLI